MPRFHFNIYDGVAMIDIEGSEYPSWEAARSEAVNYAREIIGSTKSFMAAGEDWRMEVTDDQGAVLLLLDSSLIELSASLRVPGKKRKAR